MPSLLFSLLMGIGMVIAVMALAGPSCSGTSPGGGLMVGLEYQIKDTPVTLVVTPTSKGGYDWEFKVAEGELTDWLEKLPDGSYLVTAKDGTKIKVARTTDGRPIITIIATGEKAPVKVTPAPTPKATEVTPLPVT